MADFIATGDLFAATEYKKWWHDKLSSAATADDFLDIGVRLFTGNQCEQSYEAAVYCFKRAIAVVDDRCYHHAYGWLGYCYYGGHGVKQSNAWAIHYMRWTPHDDAGVWAMFDDILEKRRDAVH